MSDNDTLLRMLRPMWASACMDEPQRQSCRVEDGKFVMTINGNKENWQRLVHLNGVPSHAQQIITDDKLTCIWPSHADSIFGDGGMMAQALPDYEVRRPQIHMARLVQRAIEMNDIAIVEAGTGTGKSFAYAAICMAMDKQVVISTSNKALQTQLYTKDIPFLQGLFPGKSMALAMGKSNYACKHKVQGETSLSDEAVNNDKQFMDWYWWTDTGNLEEVEFEIDRELRAQVNVDDECLGKHCPLYDHCFYFAAKEERMRADVVVCNHALLAQHHMTGYLLPEWDVLVVDEAHNIVDTMREAVGTEVNVGALYKHINTAKPYVAAESIQFMEALVERFRQECVGDHVNGFGSNEVAVQDNRTFAMGEKTRIELLNLADMVWDELDMPQGSADRKAQKRAEKIRNAADRIRSFLTIDDQKVRWIKFDNDKPYLYAMPYYIGDVMSWLSQREDKPVPTIYCSATLATPDLYPFMESIGCTDALQMVVKSPFDYGNNALLYVPRSSDPDPKDKEFGQYLYRQLTNLIAASKGGALLLFTSRRQMDQMYSLMALELRKVHKLTVLHQDGRTANQELVRQFRQDGHAVLFATRSFFEGVSIDGDALRLVVLDKLPFEAPSPLGEAMLKAAGGMAFERVTVPQMLIVLKQAVGRLIRTRTDRGVIAVLDSRIRSKWAKRVFGSLPESPDTQEIAEVAEFFGGDREPVATQAILFEHAPVRRYG